MTETPAQQGFLRVAGTDRAPSHPTSNPPPGYPGRMEFGAGIATGEGDLWAEAKAAADRGFTTDPDLVMVFATPDAVDALGRAKGPWRSIGCIADGVIGGMNEVEEGPAVAVWQASFGGAEWSVCRIKAVQVEDGIAIRGWRHPPEPTGAIVLVDPASFPTSAFVAELAAGGIPVMGGLATSSQGTQLMVDGATSQTGAVAVAFGRGVQFQTTVSQGCRPIGEPLVVTQATGGHILEIGGRRAFDVLSEVVRGLDDSERDLVRSGLQIGIAADEYQESFEIGDFLIRPVVNLDEEVGFVAAGGRVDVGRTIQFHVRDPESAAQELDHMLSGADAPAGSGALLFTCNGRGRRFFGRPNHDAALVAAHRAPRALAGFFAAGEIGPVAGANHLHAYTASLLELGPAG